MDNDTRELRRESLQHATRNFLAGKDNLSEVARSLGISITRQALSYWGKGTHFPGEMTAWKIVLSKNASPEAKQFANRILDIYAQYDWSDWREDGEIDIEELRNGTY